MIYQILSTLIETIRVRNIIIKEMIVSAKRKENCNQIIS